MYSPKIYSASKIWHNVKWKLMDDVGYPITARWIWEECGTAENPTGAKQFTAEEKIQLWIECHEDVTRADMVIVYGEEKDELRGAVMEWGINMGQNKPTYVIGNAPFFYANGKSDAAYMHHPLVHWLKDVPMNMDGSFDYAHGYHLATMHYLKHYRKPFYARITSSIARLFQKAASNTFGVLWTNKKSVHQIN
jgi:hypothetical protein